MPLSGDTAAEHAGKQELIIQEYEILIRDLLAPAGVKKRFESFILKNPDFYSDSFRRSRTSHIITELLSDKPAFLAVFKQCGLSSPGEYLCHKTACPLHGHLFKQRNSRRGMRIHGPHSYFFYLGGVIGGLFLFIGTVGAGSYVFRRLSPDISEKKEE